jgi:PAS domain S-box-containing protein
LKKFICIQYDISRIVKKEIELRRALELAEFQAQEIRNKQAQLDSIFSNISGAIYRRNKEHKIIFVSEYIAKITGYDVEDFISGNLDFGRLIHDDDRENYHAIIAEMLRNGMSFSVVYRIFNKSNELVWVREDGSGVYDDNNEIQFIDGVLINITIEKQLEDSLRDSLVELEDKQNKMREYAHILEVQKIELNGRIGALNNCGIVSETDLQGNIIFINEEATRVWGYEFDEVVGKPHNIIKSNEHTDDFFKSLWNTISVGNVWKGELKNLAKDGSDFWVQLTITPVLDSEGNPLKYIGVGFEITRIKRQSIRIKELFNESKKQEDELRKQSQQLKELHREMLATQTELTGQISAINNAALVSEADTDGKILFLNDEAVTVWGYAREEVVGRKHNILKSGYHNAEFYQSIWDSITVGKVWKGQVCNKAKDGSLFWIELTITPVLDANGVPIKYIGVSFEITKQKIQSQRIKDALALSEKSESELRAKIVKLENTIKNYEIAHEHKTLANETFNANVPLPKRTVESNSLKIIKEYMNSIVSNVMIFEFNSDGRISDLNNTFINKMSVDKSTVLDKPFTVLFSPETPHSKVMEIVKELKGNLVWSGKVELLSKTNGTVNCMLKIFPYTDESGEFKKFICIVLEEEKKVLYAMS